MTNISKIRIAGATGLIVGFLSLASGSMVLGGIKKPDYTLLKWLVIYNTIMGLVSVAVGMVIWFRQNRAAMFAGAISGMHIGVLISLILIAAFGNPVALESMGAMTFRSAVWIGITIVVVKQQLKIRPVSQEQSTRMKSESN